MVRKVVWSKRVKTDVDKTFRYISDKLSEQGAVNFVRDVFAAEIKLAKYPESGRPSDAHEEIRYFIIGQHRRLYYRIYPKTIKVLALFDTRQDPDKRPF